MIRDSCLGLGILCPSFWGLGQGTNTLRAVIASIGGATRGISFVPSRDYRPRLLLFPQRSQISYMICGEGRLFFIHVYLCCGQWCLFFSDVRWAWTNWRSRPSRRGEVGIKPGAEIAASKTLP